MESVDKICFTNRSITTILAYLNNRLQLDFFTTDNKGAHVIVIRIYVWATDLSIVFMNSQ